MKHGFKAHAERVSAGYRETLGLQLHQPLPAKDLAEHLGITVLHPHEIPDLAVDHIGHLAATDDDDWSAFTLAADSRRFIVHNDTHPVSRQESNLMHELAHICCEHECGPMMWVGPFCLRHYDPGQEDEATWLGGVLQIPKEGLMAVARRNRDIEHIATVFGASEAMARKRFNTEGIHKRLERERRGSWRR